MLSSFSTHDERQCVRWIYVDTDLLHFVKVIRFNSNDLLPKRFLNLLHLQPSFPVMDEIYGYSFPSKPSSTTWDNISARARGI